MKVEFLMPLKVATEVDGKKVYVEKPAGHIHERPDAYKLVQHGNAIPADDECRKACGMTEKDMEHAQKSYRRIAAGIQPEDYQAFDDGLMIGYDPLGNPIPGPNAETDEEDLEFGEDETDGDDAVTTE
jgi:hypothetical protein